MKLKIIIKTLLGKYLLLLNDIKLKNKFLYLICIIIMVKLQIIHLYFNKLNYFLESKICKHMENRYLKAFLILLNQ